MVKAVKNNDIFWKKDEVAILIGYLKDHFDEYKKGRKMDIYHKIAPMIQNKSPMQVARKASRLFDIYTKHKLKERATGEPSSWQYMRQMESLSKGNESMEPAVSIASDASSERDGSDDDSQSNVIPVVDQRLKRNGKGLKRNSKGLKKNDKKSKKHDKRLKMNDEQILQAILSYEEARETEAEKMLKVEQERIEMMQEEITFLRAESLRKYEESLSMYEKFLQKSQETNRKLDMEILKLQTQLNMEIEKRRAREMHMVDAMKQLEVKVIARLQNRISS